MVIHFFLEQLAFYNTWKSMAYDKQIFLQFCVSES